VVAVVAAVMVAAMAMAAAAAVAAATAAAAAGICASDGREALLLAAEPNGCGGAGAEAE
jgi:hypothetical protein